MVRNISDITEKLSRIASIFPVPFYWLDLEQKYLGVSAAAIRAMGRYSYEQDFGDKTLYDLYPQNMAVSIIRSHQDVIHSNQILSIEEAVIEPSSGEITYFNTTISPLNDVHGNIVGTLGIMIDITKRKEIAILQEKSKIFEHLANVAQILPTPVYWLDLNQKYAGVNDLVIKGTGTQSFENDFAEKTPYDLYPSKMAHEIVEHHKTVIKTGQTFLTEESIEDITSKQVKHFSATIAPLRDDDGNIIGTIGTSIDITAKKESERLALENAAHKAELEAQTKFTKNASSVAHDIRSPISTLMMIVKNCKDTPEDTRIALREIAVSIGDIANNLLSKYSSKDIETNVEERKPLLLSAVLLHLISDKKHQYKEFGHNFDPDFNQAGQLAFINIQQSSFKRMISNLINNAVDAFDGRAGKVIVKLDATDETVVITISDNGKGISEHVKEKILQNIAVTEGKADGHGLGLTQVRETLSRNEGTMSIDSQINQGTQIKLTFPRIDAPAWIAEEIRIMPDDMVVILDDDKSIHMAWDMRFEDLLKQYPQMKVRHFENCHDAVRFIESFSKEEKEKIYLLTDFELLKQELNGLHVVEKANIKRSILVTSHYADSIVLNRASHMGTKILPKQLAPEISIMVDELTKTTADIQSEESQLKKVDAILVDDDKRFADTLVQYIFRNDAIDYFEDPNEFMKKIKHYPKEARIYLDNNYKSAGIKGVHLAKELNELGFTKLYLLSGDTFEPKEMPNYLKVIRKDDIDNIKDW